MTETTKTKRWDKRSHSYRRTKDQAGTAARLLCEVFRGVTCGNFEGALCCERLAQSFADRALYSYLFAACGGQAPLSDETRRALGRELRGDRRIHDQPLAAEALLDTPLVNGETLGQALDAFERELLGTLEGELGGGHG